MIKETLSLRASGYVRRWHAMIHHGQQSVAEHSAQCLNLLFMIHPSPSKLLIKAVLYHDHPERYIGDTPAPIKRSDHRLWDALHAAEEIFWSDHETARVSLGKEDNEWLKAVDVLELVLWAHDQILIGNSHARVVAERGRKYLTTNKGTPKEIMEFLYQIKEESYRSFA